MLLAHVAQPVLHIAAAFLEGFKQLDAQVYAKFCSNQKFASTFFNDKMKVV